MGHVHVSSVGASVHGMESDRCLDDDVVVFGNGGYIEFEEGVEFFSVAVGRRGRYGEETSVDGDGRVGSKVFVVAAGGDGSVGYGEESGLVDGRVWGEGGARGGDGSGGGSGGDGGRGGLGRWQGLFRCDLVEVGVGPVYHVGDEVGARVVVLGLRFFSGRVFVFSSRRWRFFQARIHIHDFVWTVVRSGLLLSLLFVVSFVVIPLTRFFRFHSFLLLSWFF
mmetsp:Transcript_3371/g.7469  ORF Transcript_3371/g.7469 Transcript_3371/m.7469 type:complete len:222 (-) Transcript_3371:282-947(-)